MIPVNFPSASHERRFRKILGQMSKAKVERNANQIRFSFRPIDLFAFEQKLFSNGLKHCPTTNAIIKHLAQFPDERIEIHV